MQRLRELRVENELTQKELAEKILLTQTTIGKYERDELEPSIDILIKLSNVFECSIDYLLGRSDDFGNITVYKNTENIDTLSPDEQRIIERIRKNPPHNATEWIELYTELPDYMQENIFAELKGMALGYKAMKTKENRNKEQA